MYGFSRFAQGKDKGAYFHLSFVRGHRSLVRNMIRRKLKNKTELKPLVEDHDFYNPAWNNHLEPTVPKELQNESHSALMMMRNSQYYQQSHLHQDLQHEVALVQQVISPSTSHASLVLNKSSSSSPSVLDLVGRNISILNNNTNVQASREQQHPVTEVRADASVVSDDISLLSPWDEPIPYSDDWDVAYFEGSPFRLVEQVFDAAEVLEPNPVHVVPQQHQELAPKQEQGTSCRCSCRCHEQKQKGHNSQDAATSDYDDDGSDNNSLLDALNPLMVEGPM
ncbi:hypothetical protein ACA910_012429 [Epithemia clementina (nom. ined.)]